MCSQRGLAGREQVLPETFVWLLVVAVLNHVEILKIMFCFKCNLSFQLEDSILKLHIVSTNCVVFLRFYFLVESSNLTEKLVRERHMYWEQWPKNHVYSIFLSMNT